MKKHRTPSRYNSTRFSPTQGPELTASSEVNKMHPLTICEPKPKSQALPHSYESAGVLTRQNTATMLLNYPHRSLATTTLAKELQRQPQENPRQTNQNPSTASISQIRSSFPSLSRVFPQFFLVNKMKRFWGKSGSPEKKGKIRPV
ncbi:hypothetical protein Droror1_Dr00025819 [Drosera rotundifolia]